MQKNKKKIQLHFIGIGGIGMSGIAEVLFNQGYKVTGSDQSDTEVTKRLRGMGITVSIGHHPEHVVDASAVVVSSAIKKTNPEIQKAIELRIPVIPRAEMLGELMRGKTGIAVAGTHGKTTTTTMMATILNHCEKDPTIVVGGRVDAWGSNARLGQGEFVVAEADESDGSFLHLPATYSIITNIDNDHLDHFKSLDAIDQAFLDFVARTPFYGVSAVCGDDAGVQRVLHRFTKPTVTYGLEASNDYYARAIEYGVSGLQFDVFRNQNGASLLLGKVKLQAHGVHNVMNAVACIAIADQIGINPAQACKALEGYQGVKRRFEVCWSSESRKIRIVDDYGHHPTEIAATLAGARKFWPGRIFTIFQPHRFSRTLHCHDGFMTAFREADFVVVTDIYSAGEEPIEGVTAKNLVLDMERVKLPNQKITHLASFEMVKKFASDTIQNGDLVICFGAGSITKFSQELAGMISLGAKP